MDDKRELAMERSIEERLARVEAQLAIQQLASRYARAVDSRDLDTLGALFAPQTPFGEHGTGAEGARGFYSDVLRGFYRSFHQVVGHVITDIDVDSARGTVYCRAEHEDGDHWVVNLMVYFDRYVRVDGTWHFLGRRPRFLFVGDMKDGPQAVGFNLWPGREDRFRTELPQSDASWQDYWAQFPEDVARLSRFP